MRNKRSNIRPEVEISGFASDCFVKSQSQEVIFMDSNPKSLFVLFYVCVAVSDACHEELFDKALWEMKEV